MTFLQRAGRWLGIKSGGVQTFEDFARQHGIPTHNLGALSNISVMDALGITAVWAACRVIADGVAQVPWKLFRKTDDGREEADDHSLFDLLKTKPNDIQTSFEFRETLIFHLMLTGNAYVFVNRVGNDREVRSLMPLQPERVTVKDKDGVITYKLRLDTGTVTELSSEFIWHIRGPAWNPTSGLNIIALAARALRLSMEEETAHLALFKHGISPSGVLSMDGNLSAEKYKMLVDHIEAQAKGDKRSRALVMDNGAKWTSLMMKGVDAEHIDARKFQLDEVARMTRVQPIMLMQADKAATSASSENMFITHVVHSLAPWYTRIEMSADCNLLTDDERRGGLYTKFLPIALLRGALKAQSEYFKAALGAGNAKGWMTQNEVRAANEQNKHADPAADDLPQPVAGADGAATDDGKEPENAED